MSHAIKVSDAVFKIILHYQAPRETISHVIERAFEGFIVLDKIKRGEFPPTDRPEPIKQEA
jgi:hypothetical protein